jgi:chorismate mutase
LLALFNQRARLALRVGRVKRTHKLPVFDPKREAAVLRRLARANRGPLSRASVRQIFRQILSHSRQLERSG